MAQACVPPARTPKGSIVRSIVALRMGSAVDNNRDAVAQVWADRILESVEALRL